MATVNAPPQDAVAAATDAIAAQLSELADRIDRDLQNWTSPPAIAVETMIDLRHMVADLRYGRLPDEWMSRDVSYATCCPVCGMYPRRGRDGAGAAVLRHRPYCPRQEDS